MIWRYIKSVIIIIIIIITWDVAFFQTVNVS